MRALSWPVQGRRYFRSIVIASSPLIDRRRSVITTPSFGVSARRRLFSVSDYWNNQNHARYDVMPDGQSFVMIGVTSSSGTGIETVVVTNWLSEIEKR